MDICASNLWTLARGTYAGSGGVDRDELGALLAEWVVSIGLDAVGSATCDSSTVSAKLSTIGGT